MLEIVRGRTYELIQTLLDHYEGPNSDMTHIVDLKCQIRTAANNELVVTATATLTGFKKSILTISLTRAQTALIELGDYKIDVVGYDSGGNDESLMDPEAIKVTDRPSSVTAGDVVSEDFTLDIPDFVQIAQTALND